MGLFFIIFVFSIQLTISIQNKILPMTGLIAICETTSEALSIKASPGFEPQITGKVFLLKMRNRTEQP